MEKALGQKSVEKGIAVGKETEFSPEEIGNFEEIRLRLADYSFHWKNHLSWKRFRNSYKNADWSLREKEKLLEQRKAWFEAKKSGAKFEKYLTNYIRERLESGRSVFLDTRVYLSLGASDASNFLGELLGNDKMLAKKDGSTMHEILDYFAATRDKNAVNAITKHIQDIYSDSYGRKEFRDNDSYRAIDSLKAILGEKTEDFLEQWAESSSEFSEWLDRKKKLPSLKRHPVYKKELQIDDFDEALEANRIIEIEDQYEYLRAHSREDREQDEDDSPDDFELAFKEGLVSYGGDMLSMPLSMPGETRDSFKKPEKQIRPENLFSDYEMGLGIRARGWETGKLVNFYGRFLPKIENPVTINAENYLSVLISNVLEKKENEKDFFGFISGLAKLESTRAELPETMSNEDAYRSTALAVARSLCLAGLERRFDDAVAEIEVFKDYLGEVVQKTADRKSANFILALVHELVETQNYIAVERISGKNEPEISESADSFFIYYHKLKRSREIPDFHLLLSEKIRHYLALDVFNNSEKVELFDEIELGQIRPAEGPSFSRFRSIVDLYRKNLELYREVEEEDIPLYWEAKERLEDFDSQRNVVFGRDGRYFFTALKASGFGIKNRGELKYVIITRLMRDNVTDSQVAAYLRQNGVSLDFTYIDTGFSGSIPEFAIRCLAGSEGISLPAKEIDEKIKLLSSSFSNRRQLFRKRSTSRSWSEDPVKRIEGRPQKIESPRYFKMDERGKLKVEEVPDSVSAQLQAWTVEHAVMRSFAPRLDAEKRVKYLRKDSLGGARFIQDFCGVSIGTHPMELWEDRNGGKFLLKGGPDHTLRADFVGAKFLELVGAKTPNTEFIFVDGQPKLKMNYLGGWESGGIRLSEKYHQSKGIQAGFLVDLLLGQYDRTPWNFMFKEDDVAFIDNGGSLFSRARGGYKGFAEKLEIQDLEDLLNNPQFPGQPSNEAYSNLVEVRDGKVVVKDKKTLKSLMREFFKISNHQVEDIIDDARFPDEHRSVANAEKTVKQLENDLGSMSRGSDNYRKTAAAIETFKKIIEAGGEATYLKKAIRQRCQDIIDIFGPPLV